MNEFEKWWAGYNDAYDNLVWKRVSHLNVAQAAFRAGMLRAAEIAESKEGSWADLEWNEAVHDIAASIRKEAEDEHNNN